MKNNHVAVLMTVYKTDDLSYLKSSVKSMLNQTYAKVDVHIGVDGPLNDEMMQFLKEKDSLSNLFVHWYVENRGLAIVLNNLLEDIKSEGYGFYARMDADDIAHTDRFQKQVDFLKSNPDIDIVGGAIEEINFKGELNGKVINYPLTSKECRSFFAYRDPVAHPAVMFRASFFCKVKGYRPEFRKNQDTMLWFDALMADCKIANLEDIVLSFRVSDDLYKRRGGYAFSKSLYQNRLKINRALGYGSKANLFAFVMFIIRILPTWMVGVIYKIR